MAPRTEVENARRRELYAERLADPMLRAGLRKRQQADRDRIAASPELAANKREVRRAWQKRNRKADPQKWAEYRRIRTVKRAIREGREVPPPRFRKPPTGVPTGRPLPAPGFQAWLAEYGRLRGFGDNSEAIAHDLEIEPRRVRAMLGSSPQASVCTDIVDMALINAAVDCEVTFLAVRGDDVRLDRRLILHLDDLYPQLAA